MVIVMSGGIAAYDPHFRSILEQACPDFAWQVMALEVELEEQQSTTSMDSVMRLIQLYMLGVEVLENEDDSRYNFFNKKIQALMMRRAVIEQLHRTATGHAPDPATIEMAQLRELENKKSEHELQVFLQKDQYNPTAIATLIRKEQKHSSQRGQKIREALVHQQQRLQERIKGRKMRSISASKHTSKEPRTPKQNKGIASSQKIANTPNPRTQNGESDIIKFWSSPPKPKKKEQG